MKKFFIILITALLTSLQIYAQILGDLTCYTVAHNNGAANVLLKLDAQTNQWTEIGLTGTNNIKAITTDQVNNIIYAVNGSNFGTINSQTGQFSTIGTIGQASGEAGTVNLNNIEGLAYNYSNNIMYATHRVESGAVCNPIPNSNDLLFQIDITTGSYIPGAMLSNNGNPANYAIIEEIFANTILDSCGSNGTLNDVNDIAYNTYTGELYVISNQQYVGELAILNPLDASIEAIILDLEDNDIISLAFGPFGDLFATSGANAVNKPKNSLQYIDIQNQLTNVLSIPDPSGSNFDFRGLGCFTAYNDLALRLTIDPNTPAPINPGEAVTLLIEIYNQGDIDNNDISIISYIPDGLQLNDPEWILIPNANVALYDYSGQLAPLNNITIPVSFIVDANFTGTEITSSAEIVSSFNNNITDITGNPLPLADIDSQPDDTNNELLNGDTVIDDKINQNGPNANEDEDDHDIAIIAVEEGIVDPPLNQIYFPCYTVSEDGGSFPNMLFEFDPSSQMWTNIGEIDPIGDKIEAIATDPINDIIYAYDAGRAVLGIINPDAANNRTLFTPINESFAGQGVGTANGNYGAVKLDDVDGLTFDPVNMILYGTHRINSGAICNTLPNSNDVLFQIDISTGRFVPGAMLDANDNPVDYAIIEEVVDRTLASVGCPGIGGTGGAVYDVDDIAYNPYDGELYAISNQDGPGTITWIDEKNGNLIANLFDTNKDDIEGLGFSYTGKLYATMGDNGTGGNEFLELALDTQTETVLPYPDATGEYVDFEAFDCFTAYNDLALSYTVAPGAPFTINAGTEITFLVNVYNQGDFTNTNITINNYIPNGLTLIDNAWTFNNVGFNKGNAVYTITEELEPGDLITIPITFIVDVGFEGQTITGAAEISESFGVGLLGIDGNIFEEPLLDVDSNPDYAENDLTEADNKINGKGPNAIPQEDEDDYDTASIPIAALVENLSLLNTITPASCNSGGTAEIKILGNSTPPYTHKWLGSFGNLVHLETTNSTTHYVTNLPSDVYYAIVTDAAGKISSFVVTVSELAQDSGNLNCNDSCPEFLSTSSNLLSGVFQAEKEIEIKGCITGTQNTEFRVCD